MAIELEGVERQINHWNERAAQTEPESTNGNKPKPPQKRNPRGFNRQKVRDALKGVSLGSGLDLRELETITGLGQSSIRSVLDNNSDEFSKGENGKWYVKKKPDER